MVMPLVRRLVVQSSRLRSLECMVWAMSAFVVVCMVYSLNKLHTEYRRERYATMDHHTEGRKVLSVYKLHRYQKELDPSAAKLPDLTRNAADAAAHDNTVANGNREQWSAAMEQKMKLAQLEDAEAEEEDEEDRYKEEGKAKMLDEIDGYNYFVIWEDVVANKTDGSHTGSHKRNANRHRQTQFQDQSNNNINVKINENENRIQMVQDIPNEIPVENNGDDTIKHDTGASDFKNAETIVKFTKSPATTVLSLPNKQIDRLPEEQQNDINQFQNSQGASQLQEGNRRAANKIVGRPGNSQNDISYQDAGSLKVGGNERLGQIANGHNDLAPDRGNNFIGGSDINDKPSKAKQLQSGLFHNMGNGIKQNHNQELLVDSGKMTQQEIGKSDRDISMAVKEKTWSNKNDKSYETGKKYNKIQNHSSELKMGNLGYQGADKLMLPGGSTERKDAKLTPGGQLRNSDNTNGFLGSVQQNGQARKTDNNFHFGEATGKTQSLVSENGFKKSPSATLHVISTGRRSPRLKRHKHVNVSSSVNSNMGVHKHVNKTAQRYITASKRAVTVNKTVGTYNSTLTKGKPVLYTGQQHGQKINSTQLQLLKSYLTPTKKDNLMVTAHKYKLYLGMRGRLGNNMFQFASLYGIARALNRTPVISDSTELFDTFHKNIKKVALVGRPPSDIVTMFEKESGVYYGQIYDMPKQDVQICCYFQSWKYFDDYSKELRNLFQFKDWIHIRAQGIIKSATREYLQTLPQGGSVSHSLTYIGVHVRRSDYLLQEHLRRGYKPASVQYLHKAMDYFRQRHPNVYFLVCSDSIDWCKEYISNDDVYFVQDQDGMVDLAVLSMCNHTVMTVGTFSWWAAWLAGGEATYYSDWPAPKTEISSMYRHQDYFLPHWKPMAG